MNEYICTFVLFSVSSVVVSLLLLLLLVRSYPSLRFALAEFVAALVCTLKLSHNTHDTSDQREKEHTQKWHTHMQTNEHTSIETYRE